MSCAESSLQKINGITGSFTYKLARTCILEANVIRKVIEIRFKTAFVKTCISLFAVCADNGRPLSVSLIPGTGFSTVTWDWIILLESETGIWDWNVGLE